MQYVYMYGYMHYVHKKRKIKRILEASFHFTLFFLGAKCTRILDTVLKPRKRKNVSIITRESETMVVGSSGECLEIECTQ